MGSTVKKYRIEVFAIMEMISPLHLGSGREDDKFSDMPILRDTCNIPFIPGSTMAGAFSEMLTVDQKFEWMGIPKIPKSSEQKPQASRLIFDDAFPIPNQIDTFQWPIEHRHLVTLMRDSLTARPDHHFNMETLPVGTLFRFSCRCDLKDTNEEKEFLQKINLFLSKCGKLGGKQNCGCGRWECNEWGYRTLNMTENDCLKKWLVFFHGYEWDGQWTSLEKDLGIKKQTISHKQLDDSWKIEIDVTIVNGLHLSAGASGLPEKDMSDLYQANRQKINVNGELLKKEYVDFGSSIKGRLRTSMEMILRTFLIRNAKQSEEDVFKVVPVDPTVKSTSAALRTFFGHTKQKGGWWVEEHPWRNVKSERQDHIRLDEFTQQAMRGAKFDFSPLTMGESKVVIGLPKNALGWQKHLIFSACKLLSLNILPWGGHGSRGYLGAVLTIKHEDKIKETFNPFELKELIEKGDILHA